MVTTPRLELAALNVASPRAFRAALGPLFEHAPRFLSRLAAERPFATWDDVFDVGRAISHVMPEAEQVELVNAHPRLGADPGSVSSMSFREQGYGRRTPVDGDVAAELERLNAAYEARFGFRYCVFVAGRPRAALLPGMRAALTRERADELERALDAVVDIARARLATEREASDG